MSRRLRDSAIIALAASLLAGGQVFAQSLDSTEPTNDLPNEYQAIDGWAKMPAGRYWGSTSAVDIDPDGRSIWVAERCGGNSCANSDLPVVLKFNQDGDLVRSFGSGMFVFPHGFHVDFEGNVWVTDGRSGDGKGNQVIKFSPEGEVLLTLGEPGVTGTGPGEFNQPSDVHVAPNGNIFVADGHGGRNSNSRIQKFDSEGNFLMEWGERGSEPGQFGVPHGLAMDSQGRLFVADRSNNRIQIFTQDGELLDIWHQFSRLSGIFITDDDMLYGADSESNDGRDHGEWKRGIRIGNARTGEVTGFIPDPADANDGPLRGTSAAEGVAVDVAGNIYGAEVGPRALKRYVKRPPGRGGRSGRGGAPE